MNIDEQIKEAQASNDKLIAELKQKKADEVKKSQEHLAVKLAKCDRILERIHAFKAAPKARSSSSTSSPISKRSSTRRASRRRQSASARRKSR